MGGSSQPAQTQQTSKVELPAWVNEASQENWQMAKDVAGRPLQQYQGDRVADTSKFTNQAYDLMQQYLGSTQGLNAKAEGSYDTAQSYLGQAGDMYKSTAPVIGQAGAAFDKVGSTLDKASPLYDEAAGVYRGTTGNLDIQPFLNPYTNEVEQRAIGNANTALDQRLAGQRSQAQLAGGFGGSRFGVQQGVTEAEGARGIGDLSAALRKQGIDYATSTAIADRAGKQAGAAGLLGTAAGIGNQAAGYGQQGAGYLGQAGAIGNAAAGLANTAAGYGNAGAGYNATAAQKLTGNAQDLSTLFGAGLQEQGQRQNEIAADMAKFDEAKNYPVEQLNMRLAALGMSPYGKTETMNKTATSEDKGTDWATLGLGALQSAGPLMKGAASLAPFLMMSDRNTKTDIKKLTDGDIPLYSYRYKDDPKSYPKVVGPMAQDIEKKYPSAVKKVGGHRVVNLSNLMEVLK
jgi:hypothetical protein